MKERINPPTTTGANRLGRRAFLHGTSLVLMATGTGVLGCLEQDPNAETLLSESKPKMRIGMITDLHYADKDSVGTRHYRESLSKLAEARERFEKEKIDFVVEMGDLVDAAGSVDVETGYLKKINGVLTDLPCDIHYVVGNHCVHTLTKKEFLSVIERDKTYYSFDSQGFHFIALDACFRSDGESYGRKNFDWQDSNIPPEQIEWLREDLGATEQPTIVFVHQRLDVAGHYSVKNAAQVREVLEHSEKVMAVFQGHSHENSYQEINKIHYCVLTAMVEGTGAVNSGYSVLDIVDNNTLRLNGYRNQIAYAWQ